MPEATAVSDAYNNGNDTSAPTETDDAPMTVGEIKAELETMTAPEIVELMLDVKQRTAELTQRYEAKLRPLATMAQAINEALLHRVSEGRVVSPVRVGTKAVSLRVERVAHRSISDFDTFADWVIATGHVEVFQRRLNEKNLDAALVEVKDAIAAGQLDAALGEAPGISTFHKDELRITTREGKTKD